MTVTRIYSRHVRLPVPQASALWTECHDDDRGEVCLCGRPQDNDQGDCLNCGLPITGKSFPSP